MVQSSQQERVCVATVVGAHGVKGLITLRAFTETPEAVADYGPVETEDGGRRLRLAVAGRAGKGRLLARVEGVSDRDDALALRGHRLYVRRDCLPPPADEQEFYHADLLGASVVDLAGAALGKVAAIHDFGAGDVLIVRDDEGAELALPFTRAVVPTVDVEGRRLIVDPPSGLDDEHEAAGSTSAESVP